MKESKEILGQKIRKARIELGLSQAKLAEILGIDTRTILNIEAGRGNPKFDSFCTLIHFLKIPCDAVFYPESNQADTEFAKLDLALRDCTPEEIKEIAPGVYFLIDLIKRRG